MRLSYLYNEHRDMCMYMYMYMYMYYVCGMYVCMYVCMYAQKIAEQNSAHANVIAVLRAHVQNNQHEFHSRCASNLAQVIFLLCHNDAECPHLRRAGILLKIHSSFNSANTCKPNCSRRHQVRGDGMTVGALGARFVLSNLGTR